MKISDELFELLNGKEIQTKQHEAMMLLTVTNDLWPHTAMISVGEIVALNKKELRLALWRNTVTNANVRRTGKATLVVLYQGVANYIRLSLQPLQNLENEEYPLDRFTASIAHIKEDIAKYADITAGIQVQLKDPDAVLERWQKQVEELLLP